MTIDIQNLTDAPIYIAGSEQNGLLIKTMKLDANSTITLPENAQSVKIASSPERLNVYSVPLVETRSG